MIASQTIVACNGGLSSEPLQAPRPGEITATFTVEGYTLGITTICQVTGTQCPFRAEIYASPALFELIEQVEYNFPAANRKSPALITDASTHFRFKAEQNAGEKVYAKVKLRSGGGAPPKIVQLEGTIPFAAEVTPPLSGGLRFEINYQPWYLEGVPHEPVEYVFKIKLHGEPDALKRIKSVKYRFAGDTGARITHRVESGYYLEGSIPIKESVSLIAVIRWKGGGNSTHTIPLRPR